MFALDGEIYIRNEKSFGLGALVISIPKNDLVSPVVNRDLK